MKIGQHARYIFVGTLSSRWLYSISLIFGLFPPSPTFHRDTRLDGQRIHSTSYIPLTNLPASTLLSFPLRLEEEISLLLPAANLCSSPAFSSGIWKHHLSLLSPATSTLSLFRLSTNRLRCLPIQKEILSIAPPAVTGYCFLFTPIFS